MKQNGAVLLITIVVLAMLASLSQLHMSTIMMNEKSTFNQMQYYRSMQYAEQGLADNAGDDPYGETSPQNILKLFTNV